MRGSMLIRRGKADNFQDKIRVSFLFYKTLKMSKTKWLSTIPLYQMIE